MMSATGVPDGCEGRDVPAGHRDRDQKGEAEDAGEQNRRPHGAWHDPLGLIGLLGQVAAGFEAHDGEGAEQKGEHPRAVVAESAEAEVRVHAGNRALAEEVAPVQLAGDSADDQDEDREAADADELRAHGDAVDACRPERREHDQQALRQDDRARHEPGIGRGARVAEQRRGDRGGDGVVDRDRVDDQEGEHEPANQPTDQRVRQARHPLVGVAGQRHAGRQGTEDQSHRELPDDHDRPRPDAERSRGVQDRARTW